MEFFFHLRLCVRSSNFVIIRRHTRKRHTRREVLSFFFHPRIIKVFPANRSNSSVGAHPSHTDGDFLACSRQ